MNNLAQAVNPIFPSLAAQEAYFNAYADSLTLWPVPVERFDAPGKFGTTHVIAAGPKDAPPMILLHGMGVSSTSWYPNIGALSAVRRCYALDYPGDVNCSVCTRPMRTPDQTVEWLNGVLDFLQVKSADFAGLSYGGFLTMNYVRSAPERVRRAVAICPAAVFAPIKVEFIVRLGALLFFPTSRVRDSFSQWMLEGRYIRPPVVEQHFRAGMRVSRRQLRMRPVVFSDEQLRRISRRVLVLTGEREVLCDPAVVVQRARLMPQGEAQSYSNAGHALPLELPERVNERMVRFLTE
jgi:pimeloyl-ACP methyl ester carboxylesterase